MPNTDRFGRWVTEKREIVEFNDSNECVCGDSDIVERHWLFDIARCRSCNREYVFPEEENGAVHPESFLSTDNDGLVHYSENVEAFYLLAAYDSVIAEYIEMPTESEEKWLWTADGVYIGYLYYNFGSLKAMVIAGGFRGQGHGTAFLEEWLETIDDDELQIMAYEYTKPFFNRFDIPIEYV